jgi:hypothetical protein
MTVDWLLYLYVGLGVYALVLGIVLDPTPLHIRKRIERCDAQGVDGGGDAGFIRRDPEGARISWGEAVPFRSLHMG